MGLSFARDGRGFVFSGSRAWMTTDRGAHSAPVSGDTEAVAFADGAAIRIAFHGDGCPGPCRALIQVLPSGSQRWQTVHRHASGFSNVIVTQGSLVLGEMFGHPAGGAPNGHTSVWYSTNAGFSGEVRADPCGTSIGRSEYDAASVLADSRQVAALCLQRHSPNRAVVRVSHDDGQMYWTHFRVPKWVDDQAAGLVNRDVIIAGTDQKLGKWNTTIDRWADGRWQRQAHIETRVSRAAGDLYPDLSCAGSGCVLVGVPDGPYISTDGGKVWHRRAA